MYRLKTKIRLTMLYVQVVLNYILVGCPCILPEKVSFGVSYS